MTPKDLQLLENVSVDRCNASCLKDIKTIHVDRSLPVSQRMTCFLNAAGNPYLFRVNDVVVKVNFNPGGKRFSDALSDALRSD